MKLLDYRQPTLTPPVRQRLRDLMFDLFIGGMVAIIVTIALVFFYGVLLPR